MEVPSSCQFWCLVVLFSCIIKDQHGAFADNCADDDDNSFRLKYHGRTFHVCEQNPLILPCQSAFHLHDCELARIKLFEGRNEQHLNKTLSYHQNGQGYKLNMSKENSFVGRDFTCRYDNSKDDFVTLKIVSSRDCVRVSLHPKVRIYKVNVTNVNLSCEVEKTFEKNISWALITKSGIDMSISGTDISESSNLYRANIAIKFPSADIIAVICLVKKLNSTDNDWIYSPPIPVDVAVYRRLQPLVLNKLKDTEFIYEENSTLEFTCEFYASSAPAIVIPSWLRNGENFTGSRDNFFIFPHTTTIQVSGAKFWPKHSTPETPDNYTCVIKNKQGGSDSKSFFVRYKAPIKEISGLGSDNTSTSVNDLVDEGYQKFSFKNYSKRNSILVAVIVFLLVTGITFVILVSIWSRISTKRSKQVKTTEEIQMIEVIKSAEIIKRTEEIEATELIESTENRSTEQIKSTEEIMWIETVRDYIINGKPSSIRDYETVADPGNPNVKICESEPPQGIYFGEFSKVYMVLRIDRNDERHKMIVKTYQLPILSSGHDEIQACREFIKEIKIMQYLGEHPHIVKYMGVIAPSLLQCKVNLLLDYCEPGELSTFLHAQKENELKSGTNNLRIRHLIKWAAQIASAMVHVSGKKIVHRDIAARNILLKGASGENPDFDELVVVLADFGLARNLKEMEDSYVYVMDMEKARKSRMLPIWLYPIEALNNSGYTCQSDVWSFGCLLWEMFTLAKENPYETEIKRKYQSNNGNLQKNLLEHLELGKRLARPLSVPDEMWKLMVSCWLENPEERPTFKNIHLTLIKLNTSDELGQKFDTPLKTIPDPVVAKTGYCKYSINPVLFETPAKIET